VDSPKILVADDEAPNLDLFRVILKQDSLAATRDDDLARQEQALFGDEPPEPVDVDPGVELECFRQAEEAVNAVREAVTRGTPYAAAFLDVRMPPGPNGVWAAKRIRAMDPNIYIVFVTAFSDVSPDAMTRDVPPADRLLYIKKPIQPEELKQVITSVIKRFCTERGVSQSGEEVGSDKLWDVYRSLVCRRLWG
jgi:CheY-like chemotaxis protein